MSTSRNVCLAASRCQLVAALLVLSIAVSLVVAGSAAAADPQPAGLWVHAPKTITTGNGFTVTGGLTATADLSGETVNIYRAAFTLFGETTDTLLGVATVTNDGSGNVYSVTLPGQKYDFNVKATWTGNADYLPGSCETWVGVRPRLKLRARVLGGGRVRLRVTSTPTLIPAFMSEGQYGMVFQCRRHGRWRFVGAARTSDFRTFFAVTVIGPIGPDQRSRLDVYLKPGIRVLRACTTDWGRNAPTHSNKVCIRVR